MYETVLSKVEPTRELYLAVTQETWDSILREELGQMMLDEHIQRAFSFSVEAEEIIEWKL
jgi:hypothetical protein